MASQTAVSLPSSPPPSAQAYSAPADETASDPEEYETASDPEEIVLTSSSTKKDQQNSSNEGDVHDSSQNGGLREDYGSAMDLNDVILAVREKLGEGEKLSSVPQNPSGNDVSGRGDVAKSAETGDSQIEKVDSLSGEIEQPIIYDTGVSQELNPKELGEGDTSFAAIEPKTSESSSSSLNQNAFEELVPEVTKSESVVVVASGEVEDDAQRGDAADVERNDKSVKIDELLPAHNNVLVDNHVGVVAPTTDEVEAELHANGADKIESDVDDSKGTDDAIDKGCSEGSKGEVNLMKGEAPGSDSINSTDEVVGEVFVGSPEMVNSESSQGTEEKPDQVYYNANSERRYTLNPEIADEKEDVGFENTSSHCEGETRSHIAKEAVVEDEITQKSSVEAEILPVIAQENVVRDDNTPGTRTESTPQKSNTDKLDDTLNQESATENLSQKSVDDKVDELGFSEISKSTPNFTNANENVLVDSEYVSLNEETIEQNTVVSSEDASNPGEDEPALQLIPGDGDLNSPVDLGTPMVAERSVLGVENSEETTTQNLPKKCNTDKLDGIYLNEQSAADMVVGSENPSSHSEGERALQLIADEGASKPAAEVEILPVTAEEIVAEDERAPQIHEFDQEVEPYVGESHVNDFKEETVEDEDEVKKIYDDPSVEVETPPATANETVVGGQQKVESDAGESQVIASTEEKSEDKDRKIYDDPAVEVETLPVTVKETVVGNGKVPQIPEFEVKVEPDAGESPVSASKEEKSGHEDEDRKVYDVPAVEVDNLSVAAKETAVGDESVPQIPELKVKEEADAGVSKVGAPKEEKDQNEDEDRKIFDGPERVAILDGPDAAKQIIREMERISSSSHSSLQGSHNYSTNVEGQIVSDSDEVLDSDEEGEGGELFDSAALAALLKAATSSSDGTVTVTAQDAARIFSGDRPVGLGASAPSLRPSAPRSARSSLFTPSETAAVEEPDRSMDDDEKRLHEKVEQIRVKFLRLVHRLGHSPADAVAGQVLYRLSLAEGIKQGRQMSRAFSIESAKKKALQLEDEGKDDLDFSCNILVIGKTGVGKSATINSIFGEEKCQTNPFQLATASVREISGVVDGVRVRVIDTPGLKASISDQATNRKILSSIKKFTKKCPPDIVLYVDRMDTQTRDFNDLPLLRSITTILGSSIWFNAIVALTHAASAPPDGPNGSPLGYEVFVTQRSHVVQQSVRQAAGDMRLMNPVALVENHPSCRRNREGERILPNGLSWRPQLLLLSYASKILSEANSLLKLQEPSPGKLFGGFRLRSPPLPFLLSSLLQSRAHPKLSGDQGGDNADSDIDLDEFSDSEQEEEVDEYDQLPSFKPLRKSEIAMLTREQKKSYFDEYDYRVKLLQKKQWKDALRRMKEMKKKGKEEPGGFTNGDIPEYYDQDSSPAAVQVPVPDMVLPPSFDCDNPAFRYRFLEPTSQLLTRPVLDTHGWDHDCGYDGVSIEENLAISGRFPTSMALQITKDKKEFNIHLDSSVAVKHGEHGSTLAGFDIQSVGKQLAYILRGETKFDNLKKHKTAAGISVTFLGETLATGLKVEDKVSINKRLGLVASTGAVRAQGDVAYGANLEVRLRDKDYPIGQALSTLGLSLMKWRSDLALGANLQSQFSVGRNSKMAVRVGLNNKLTGQITVRTSTSDYLQIAFAGIIPLAISIYRNIKSNESYMGH